MENARNVSEKLMFVSGYVYRLLIRESRRNGMRWMAILVLKDLELLGSLSQQKLADIEQVKRPTMSVLLRQMEANGWISRTVDPANRSANLVRITPAGQRALRHIGKALRARLQEALRDLSSQDLSRLDAGLAPLTDHWMRGIENVRSAK